MVEPRPPLVRKPPTDTGKKPMADDPIAAVVREWQGKLDEATAETDRVLGECETLRTQMTAMQASLNASSFGVGEAQGIINRITNQRDMATLKMASIVDGYRSTSLATHRAGHTGKYATCTDAHCAQARDIWMYVGEAEGLELILSHPGAFWDKTVEASMPTMAVPEDERDEEEELPEPEEPLETVPFEGPVEDDLGLAPKYQGKPLRTVIPPDPLREKDRDDPGMPKKASV
jgi:hypothetical protein